MGEAEAVVSPPAGWTGDDANHHRDFGILRVHVMRLGAPAVQGWRWDVFVMGSVVAGSKPKISDLLATPEAARAGAIEWVRAFAAGVLNEVNCGT